MTYAMYLSILCLGQMHKTEDYFVIFIVSDLIM